jgi:hypothetical protein
MPSRALQNGIYTMGHAIDSGMGRDSAWSEAKALLAAANGRPFTAEEQRRWHAINAEIDRLDKRVKGMLA